MEHNGEPKFLRLEQLKDFTEDFANELGRGTYGTVFKGIDEEKNEIAVKVLKERPESSTEKDFKREFESLLGLSHQNIIQLVGYCYEEDKIYDGVLHKLQRVTRTILCFEYAQEGNLLKHMSDYGDKLDWGTCYKIIKGTCEGLCYLHNHPSGQIWHLDLKPENILLQHGMVPKIADFGLSKLMTDQTSKNTVNAFGTWKYTPDEFKRRKNRVISKEFDIYSLGVIILEMIAGTKIYEDTDFFSQQDADLAFEKWKPRISQRYYQQVKTCLQIALKCVVTNRSERPQIQNIIYDLNNVENMTQNVSVSLRLKTNSSIPEVRRDYPRWERKDNTGHTSHVLKKDKVVTRQTEPQKYGSSSSHPRRSGDKVILYVTTLGGIGKTLYDCNTIRAALQSHHVDFIEKDLFDRPDHLRELKQLLAGTSYRLPVPVLCINGTPVGDAQKLLEIHNDGGLLGLFE